MGIALADCLTHPNFPGLFYTNNIHVKLTEQNNINTHYIETKAHILKSNLKLLIYVCRGAMSDILGRTCKKKRSAKILKTSHGKMPMTCPPVPHINKLWSSSDHRHFPKLNLWPRCKVNEKTQVLAILRGDFLPGQAACKDSLGGHYTEFREKGMALIIQHDPILKHARATSNNLILHLLVVKGEVSAYYSLPNYVRTHHTRCQLNISGRVRFEGPNDFIVEK